MEIAWAEFTPVASFAGGVMIGVAALFLMLLNGRVMGMSGILSGLLVKRPDWAWRFAFVIGVIVGPLLFMGLTGAPVERQAVMSGPLLYVAAFLVGLGTAVGSGCTSGHGICGLSRFSLRSLAAVMAFMVSAVTTVALIRFLG
ncbi:MAG: YeeE/YedE family protein [Candidatus Puniceispirillaceae bacterium]